MSYFLVILIIIAIIAIIYVWYITRYQNAIPDNGHLKLDTDENKLFGKWYENNLNPIYDYTITTPEIASTFLQKIHKLDINHEFIVVGENLNKQYFELTKKNIDPNYLFYLRDIFGIPGEIAIIYDNEIRKKLQTINNFDLYELNNIMTSDPDMIISSYLQETLKIRWQQLSELNNPNIINSSGSYLYLKEPIEHNIAAACSDKGPRINLLCTNWEFEALKKRLSLN